VLPTQILVSARHAVSGRTSHHDPLNWAVYGSILPRGTMATRIASLLASGTEITWALGLGDRVVAGVEILAALLHPDRFPDVTLEGRGDRWTPNPSSRKG
jgi:hypothetical protein